MGKGTEVGKHEPCVEISEEPGLSGKKGLCQGIAVMRLEGGQECYIFQVGFEAETLIPCRRVEERIGWQRGLLCGPWWGGGGECGWVGGCGHLLEFLSSPSSLPVLCNWELRKGPNMSFFFLMSRYTHTPRMIFFSICQEPEGD